MAKKIEGVHEGFLWQLTSTKAEGRLLAEGGNRQSALGSGGTNDPNLHWQEAGNSDILGGLMAYFRGICKVYGL